MADCLSFSFYLYLLFFLFFLGFRLVFLFFLFRLGLCLVCVVVFFFSLGRFFYIYIFFLYPPRVSLMFCMSRGPLRMVHITNSNNVSGLGVLALFLFCGIYSIVVGGRC